MFPQFWQTAYALVLLPFLINNGIQITAPKVQIASRIQTNDIKHPRFFRSATAWTFTLSLPHFGQIIIISPSRRVSYTWQKSQYFNPQYMERRMSHESWKHPGTAHGAWRGGGQFPITYGEVACAESGAWGWMRRGNNGEGEAVSLISWVKKL